LRRLYVVRLIGVWTAALALWPLLAVGEPYLAVQSGFKCGTCHVNPTGGGMRKAFGTIYAQTELAARLLSRGDEQAPWDGDLNRWLAVGSDLRTALSAMDVPASATQSDFAVSRATVYTAFNAIAHLLTFYVDEQIAPGGALNREAYALVTPREGQYTFKAGRFFLPYGLRLQDDSAFVRQATGINFDTPDTGFEAGLELPHLSAQLAVTNGTGGAAELDTGKQTSLLASYVLARWRIGVSYNFNNAELGDREMRGMFAGIKTGPIAWLTELDRITDDAGSGELSRTASLIEANWRLHKGANLKVSYEHFDPDQSIDGDARSRWSAVWERFPFQTLQLRLGVRSYAGTAALPQSNRNEAFAQLHVYF
jgi:hypothetical protein